MGCFSLFWTGSTLKTGISRFFHQPIARTLHCETNIVSFGLFSSLPRNKSFFFVFFFCCYFWFPECNDKISNLFWRTGLVQNLCRTLLPSSQLCSCGVWGFLGGSVWSLTLVSRLRPHLVRIESTRLSFCAVAPTSWLQAVITHSPVCLTEFDSSPLVPIWNSQNLKLTYSFLPSSFTTFDSHLESLSASPMWQTRDISMCLAHV